MRIRNTVLRRLLWCSLFIGIAAGYAGVKSARAEQCGSYYTARPENLPDWARRGKFHYIRVDGGPIEMRKATLSDWEVTEENLEVDEYLYGRYADRMIELLKQAKINWIWITWSNGFSLQAEADQRRQCKIFLDKCHQQGIYVTAYLSASNMFWHNMFLDVPESLTWVKVDNGRPRLYGTHPHRFLADINVEAWREYGKERIRLAVQAGFDAVFFDNLQADTAGLKAYFAELQELMAAEARRLGIPKPLLLHNFHLHLYPENVNGICEVIYNEDSLLTPGLKYRDTVRGDRLQKYKPNIFRIGEPVWWVDNIRKTRYVQGDVPSWKPIMHDLDEYSLNNSPGNIFTPKQEKLSVAEASAFGTALARCIEGSTMTNLIKNRPAAMLAWQAMSQYNTFTRENEQLYINARPVSHVLALTEIMHCPAKSDLTDSCLHDMLSRASIQYDIAIIKRLPNLKIDKKYQAIIIPPAVNLTDAQWAAVKPLLAPGGKFLLPAELVPTGKADALTYTAAEIEAIVETGVSQTFLDRLYSLVPQDAVRINRPYVLASLTEVPDLNRRVVHVLNYADQMLDTVKVELTGLTRPCSENIDFLSPDESTGLIRAAATQASLRLEIQNLDTYAVIAIPWE